MTPREQRIAEAVRDACVAEFQTRADSVRATVQTTPHKPGEARRQWKYIREMEGVAAILRALDVAAAVATVPAEPDPRDRMREHLRGRMDALLGCPGMFGDDAAVEALLLTTLEVLCFAERPDLPPRFVMDAFIAFAHRKFPRIGNRRLCDHLAAWGDGERLPALLAEFRAEVEASLRE